MSAVTQLTSDPRAMTCVCVPGGLLSCNTQWLQVSVCVFVIHIQPCAAFQRLVTLTAPSPLPTVTHRGLLAFTPADLGCRVGT